MNNNSSTTSPAAAAATTASSRTISEHLALTLQTIDQLTTLFSFPPHIAKIAVDTVGPDDVTTCYNWILDNFDLEDGGGPVVPKLDCPHLELLLNAAAESDLSSFVLEKVRAPGEGDYCQQVKKKKMSELFQLKCQHYELIKMKRPDSRKRLRSEDEKIMPMGQLKCEEDYEDYDNDHDGNANTTTTTSKCCDGKENWLCLHCGMLLCSRYEHGHAKLHWEESKSAELLEDVTTLHNDDLSQWNNTNGGSGEEVRKNATGHCIAISLADLSVWCYECNAYLHHDSLTELMKTLEELKFGGSGSSSSGGNSDGDDINDVDMESGPTQEDGGVVKNIVDGGVAKNIVDGNTTNMMGLGEATKPAPIDSDEKQFSTLGSSKRKSQPAKLTGGLGATPLLLSPKVDEELVQRDATQHDDDSDIPVNDTADNVSEDGQKDDASCHSSGSSIGSDEAAIIAALLQGEQGDAIRAYLNQHGSFNTSDLGQSVPMNMPAPPTFPNEMADFLRSPLCQSICVLAGAGMSVSSGIPDFRSAGSGLYDTIQPELLTASEIEQAIIEDDPTVALDKGMFLRNPLPMLELKRDFILGTHTKRWKATLAHRFVELLHTKLGKLTRLYTQNIDGLELQTSIPKEKIVNVHGSMGAAACELCDAEVDFDEFCEQISTNIKDITGRDENAPTSSTPITCEECGKPTVKPTIVLFRGAMPQIFYRRVAEDLPECDLLIIMGTSLQVAPANSLVYRVPPTALRMVMNNEKVGRRLGIVYGEESVRDVFAHGHSDETCLDLAEQMGWLPDLAEIIDELPDSSATLLRQRLEQRKEK